jgi:flagellar protein FliO/FliZ
MPGPTDASQRKSFRPPPLLIGVGILVIALGFGLPRLMSRTTFDAFSSDSNSTQINSEKLAAIAETPSERPNLLIAMARSVVGLVIVCGVCIALTRWMSKRNPTHVGTMAVLASLSVDNRCAIHLVRAGDRRLLIGTDISGIKALTEIPGRHSELALETVPAATAEDGRRRSATTPVSSVVHGPISVSEPPGAVSTASQDEIIAMLLRLRGGPASHSSPPG